jgi:hypothetical protein
LQSSRSQYYHKFKNVDSYSEYQIFIFNYRKTIPQARKLLVIKNSESDIYRILKNKYQKLQNEKLSIQKILHWIIYNYSYNFLVFVVFKKLISARRNTSFTPEEIPIEVLKINKFFKSLFIYQYKNEFE